MSDEEDRAELRRTLAGEPSRRRLVELARLREALGETLSAGVGPFGSISSHSLLGRMPVRALLEYQRGFASRLEVDLERGEFGGIWVETLVRIEAVDALTQQPGEFLTISFSPDRPSARIRHFFPFSSPPPDWVRRYRSDP